jgi:urease accessory protein
VGADLAVMRSDTAKARADRPFVFSDLTRLAGVEEVIAFLVAQGGLPARRLEAV